MIAMLDPRNEKLVASLPHTVFLEAFLLLSPAHFIIPYRDIHQPIHYTTVKYKGYRSLSSLFSEYANSLSNIVGIRKAAGHETSLAEFKHLLDCARSIGDGDMADALWMRMAKNQIAPDRQCYTLHMEAKICDHAYTGRQRQQLRLTKFNYRMRNSDGMTPSLPGYGTGKNSVAKWAGQSFREMTELGIAGDEATFATYLLSQSRTGRMIGVKQVLKMVWNIDADAVCNGEPDLPEVQPFDRSSPLYPTDRLLFAVAQAYLTNNDSGGALRLVHFISKSYDIPIPSRVWLEIFKYAFVFTVPRNGKQRRDLSLGKVSYDFLLKLSSAMCTRPFNVQHSAYEYRLLAKAAWNVCSLFDFLHFMRLAYARLEETRRKRKDARLILQSYLANLIGPGGDPDPSILHSRGFADAVRTYDLQRLHTAQNTIIIERLARLLLLKDWAPDEDLAWDRWHLPQLLEEWQDFLPETFWVEIEGARAKFVGASLWGYQYLNTHQNIPRRRVSLSTEPEFLEEEPELDDDFIWHRYRLNSPLAQIDHPLLNRIFWDAGPHEKFCVKKNTVYRWTCAPIRNKETQLRRTLARPIPRLRKHIEPQLQEFLEPEAF